MSARIEFTTLTEDDILDANSRRKSGEVTPLKEFAKKGFDFSGKTEGLQLIILLFVIVSFCITVALAVQIIIGETQVSSHGAVSSCSELCSNVGVSLLKKGGNSVDAAIGTAACLLVAEPQYSGFGGGGFMLVHDQKNNIRTTLALDFRENAPAVLKDRIASYRNSNFPTLFSKQPGLSIGVPGELAGMLKAHSLKGKLPWSDLFLPAISIAEKGFVVSRNLGKTIMDKIQNRPNSTPAIIQLFTNSKTGRFFQQGDKMERPDLAALLRKISSRKWQAFYDGSVAVEIVKAVNDNGGVMSLSDLKSYDVETRQPLRVDFQGYTVLTMPAPSSGSLLVYTLNKMHAVQTESPTSVSYLAQLAIATKDAFYCRSLLGDYSKSVSENEVQIMKKSDNTSEDICSHLKLFTNVEDHGTSHIGVIDKNEMLVSYTSTLNHLFGSGIVTPSGIILNDQMADFSYPDDTGAIFNHIEPHKRPLSSMVPSIVYNENRPCLLRAAIGGTNGTRITSSVAQTIINLIQFGMDAKKAIEQPKIYCDNDTCELEDFEGAERISEGITRTTGITVKIVKRKLAVVGIVQKDKTVVSAYCDQSSDGKAIVY